jgi:UDP-glucuronate 4-epimerase
MAVILVTGAAGFIGSHVAHALLARGDRVIGLDNLNDYYDVTLKEARLARLTSLPGFTFRKLDVDDKDKVLALAADFPDIAGIVHLAAQAGVRHSLVDPYAYVTANLMGQVVMLELAKSLKGLRHFVYASSSSVYGGNTKTPFSVEDAVDKPISVYAATKRADELLAHTYAHLFGIPMTGLRFFTVYGPWGRPDMAAFLFTRAIVAGEPITVFNHGQMWRDFTYIDDAVTGVVRALDRPPQRGEDGGPPIRVYNLGNNRVEKLTDYIAAIEQALQKKAVMRMAPLQPGDVPKTSADIEASRHDLGFAPTTPISVGIPKFVAWFKDYYGV